MAGKNKARPGQSPTAARKPAESGTPEAPAPREAAKPTPPPVNKEAVAAYKKRQETALEHAITNIKKAADAYIGSGKLDVHKREELFHTYRTIQSNLLRLKASLKTHAAKLEGEFREKHGLSFEGLFAKVNAAKVQFKKDASLSAIERVAAAPVKEPAVPTHDVASQAPGAHEPKEESTRKPTISIDGLGDEGSSVVEIKPDIAPTEAPAVPRQGLPESVADAGGTLAASHEPPASPPASPPVETVFDLEVLNRSVDQFVAAISPPPAPPVLASPLQKGGAGEALPPEVRAPLIASARELRQCGSALFAAPSPELLAKAEKQLSATTAVAREALEQSHPTVWSRVLAALQCIKRLFSDLGAWFTKKLGGSTPTKATSSGEGTLHKESLAALKRGDKDDATPGPRPRGGSTDSE